MSFPSLNATLPPPGSPTRSEDLFAHELAALVEDIQRTRDWFNTQLDAQLANLHQLCSAAKTDLPKPQPAESAYSTSMATLFEAPRPVTPPPASEAPAAATVCSVQQAIVLPPTLTAALDPELEQATLHELNNALTRAFAEISARGDMLG
ncbi:hypothetical protein [Prosthecobacter sp.]|uniref:hypothetical protein n=1 Tax=Prosthecobacter sp. TaxID=1965333 RepID=UPI001D1E91F5|nr:hypothetical protein [Prosthecobacter sp.]MCB1277780.1 hypothetical protein [Prosthecobacter sp.]